ncbi:hypothetical protein [Polaromonas hydrogenivorans]|uniref:Uncharacterized protein n=1 Tax=Polaromonas hydrogenivorans TaxID=335476 RepID=A0AAU7LW96_9BURK
MSTFPVPEDMPSHITLPELEWIERCAIENLKSRVLTADVLAKDAASTLLLLLAGMAGALAYAKPLIDGVSAPSAWVSAAVALWLALLAALMVLGCLMTISIPAVYNQPNNLLMRDPQTDSWVKWRYSELLNIQDRINAAVKRNKRIAKRLNQLRILATATPLVAILAGWIMVEPAKPLVAMLAGALAA